MRRATQYLVSVPERIIRAVAAALGGTIHETAELVLPRLVRKSRFYEATAKNLLRITVELVGGVEREAEAVPDEVEQSPKRLAVRKAGGNVVELGLDPRVRLLAAVAPGRARRTSRAARGSTSTHSSPS